MLACSRWHSCTSGSSLLYRNGDMYYLCSFQLFLLNWSPASASEDRVCIGTRSPNDQPILEPFPSNIKRFPFASNKDRLWLKSCFIELLLFWNVQCCCPASSFCSLSQPQFYLRAASVSPSALAVPSVTHCAMEY